ncbi:hypothetical protein JKP88DRAFT_251123 [Tribonema minus]|uniref:Uncharacterized protein n=1 Tax=Tribonema minus TaxID=303371 RepID=A0A835ZE65_9STRA|nr:hypothetical protein JKP88DRAFT_251123 [Tribonema minus]
MRTAGACWRWGLIAGSLQNWFALAFVPISGGRVAVSARSATLVRPTTITLCTGRQGQTFKSPDEARLLDALDKIAPSNQPMLDMMKFALDMIQTAIKVQEAAPNGNIPDCYLKLSCSDLATLVGMAAPSNDETRVSKAAKVLLETYQIMCVIESASARCKAANSPPGAKDVSEEASDSDLETTKLSDMVRDVTARSNMEAAETQNCDRKVVGFICIPSKLRLGTNKCAFFRQHFHVATREEITENTALLLSDSSAFSLRPWFIAYIAPEGTQKLEVQHALHPTDFKVRANDGEHRGHRLLATYSRRALRLARKAWRDHDGGDFLNMKLAPMSEQMYIDRSPPGSLLDSDSDGWSLVAVMRRTSMPRCGTARVVRAANAAAEHEVTYAAASGSGEPCCALWRRRGSIRCCEGDVVQPELCRCDGNFVHGLQTECGSYARCRARRECAGRVCNGAMREQRRRQLQLLGQ